MKNKAEKSEVKTSVLEVVAGVVLLPPGFFLIAQKKEKTESVESNPSDAMGGIWEFPGGKIEAGESHEQALRRELCEELGVPENCIEVHELLYVAKTSHANVHFYSCQFKNCMPVPLEHMCIKIIAVENLMQHRFHRADELFLKNAVR